MGHHKRQLAHLMVLTHAPKTPAGTIFFKQSTSVPYPVTRW